MIEARCDYCTAELEKVYTPKGTRRGLSVYTCPLCGLVQSLPRIDHVEDRTVSTSGEADWGNVRYGKSFRAKFAATMLDKHLDVSAKWGMGVLDVGAGRGDFIYAFNYRHRFPNTTTLIEPDANLLPEAFEIYHYEKVTVDWISWIIDRFENVYLPPNTYDVVHCSHTLEHMASPMATLKKIWDTMTMGGLLFIEVPNIEIIGSINFVEEFFIDKHLYHFSYLSLAKYLRWTDFEIVEANITQENVSVVAKKVEYTIFETEKELRDAHLLQVYALTKPYGSLFVKQQAERINKLTEEKEVVIWGAGRIYNLLLKAGLAAEKVWIVDKYLPDPSIMIPQEFAEAGYSQEVELIVIASREYAKEIEIEARELGFECEIVTWNDVK